jgi:hypothetical protein
MGERTDDEDAGQEKLADRLCACGYMFFPMDFKSDGLPNSGLIERSRGRRVEERRDHEEEGKEELAGTRYACGYMNPQDF